MSPLGPRSASVSFCLPSGWRDQRESVSPAPCPTGFCIQTCCFSLKETFLTSADELYRTFINQEVPVSKDQSKELPWTLQHLSFLVPPLDHYATISLELVDRGDATELKLECRGVPAGEEETTREGWNRFYFQAIKQTFGY
ncbi:hypothetical protein GOODEAATRI_010510 [Goodea atripinnis]|uniref:Activator of Hsp90 ATPase homologue 1/2-like C-terminal domain-containing protein n=1 Tax=Goodea atripinnis TaxID=208336 RepID=A0ABV0PWW2_9TELE